VADVKLFTAVPFANQIEPMIAQAGEIDVLHIVPDLSMGGAEQMLTRLVTAPRDAPVRCAVVQILSDDTLADTIRAAGVPVYSMQLQRMLALPAAVTRLVALIRRLRPRAIQSWMYYADLLALAALEVSGCRQSTRLYWGVRCSQVDFSQYRRMLRWTVSTCGSLSGRPDAIVANSFAGREIHRRLGYLHPAFYVIPNGIDTDHFRFDPRGRERLRAELAIEREATVAIHVGRIDPLKDHKMLLAVAEAVPELRFLAVGAGTETLAGARNLRGLGLRRDVPQLLSAADVFVLTSRFGEGFPNALAEAMATSLPVVTTDVGDARRIVGDTGTAVAPGDRLAMVAALKHLAQADLGSRRKQGDRCRARIVSEFSLRSCVAAFDSLHLHGTAPVDRDEGPACASRAIYSGESAFG
jgi:glycosyltransferase involved in cell wall biosynthesis